MLLRKILLETKKYDKNIKYYIDSGLGGRYSLKYIGEKDGKLEFRVLNPDFNTIVFKLTPVDAARRITEQ